MVIILNSLRRFLIWNVLLLYPHTQNIHITNMRLGHEKLHFHVIESHEQKKKYMKTKILHLCENRALEQVLTIKILALSTKIHPLLLWKSDQRLIQSINVQMLMRKAKFLEKYSSLKWLNHMYTQSFEVVTLNITIFHIPAKTTNAIKPAIRESTCQMPFKLFQ